MTIYVVEHRWRGQPWCQTRPIYRDPDVAATIAERMATEIPERSAVRAGYRTRVTNWAGSVYATFPRSMAEPVQVDVTGELGARLDAVAKQEQRPVSAVARDALATQLGVWDGS